jgi:hypothetical protein
MACRRCRPAGREVRNTEQKETSHLEEIGVPEGGREAENVVSLGVLGDGLHDGAVDDDEVLGRRLHRASFARVARVEEQRGALEAHPVTLPAALPRQLDLVLLAEQPLFHAEKPEDTKHTLKLVKEHIGV